MKLVAVLPTKMFTFTYHARAGSVFLFIDLYKSFQELSMHTKIVIGVKNDDLFENEVEKVIRPKAALNAPFLNVKMANIATFGWKS